MTAEQKPVKDVYKELAQLRKASKMAVAIIRSEPTLPKSREVVERVLRDPNLRRRAERSVGVRMSSEVTWQMVVQLLS